jgi:hypothetical protein
MGYVLLEYKALGRKLTKTGEVGQGQSITSLNALTGNPCLL